MSASTEHPQPRLVVDAERPGVGVGAILCGARLACDEELRDVAAALRIRLPYLEAIEDGNICELPGMTYGIGFVRAYAEYLGLDQEDLVSRFKVEARGIDRRTELQFPEPLPSNRVPSTSLLIFVLLLACAVYAGWLYTSTQDISLVEAIEQAPQRLQSLAGVEPEMVEPASVESNGEQTAAPEPAATDAVAASEPAEAINPDLPAPTDRTVTETSITSAEETVTPVVEEGQDAVAMENELEGDALVRPAVTGQAIEPDPTGNEADQIAAVSETMAADDKPLVIEEELQAPFLETQAFGTVTEEDLPAPIEDTSTAEAPGSQQAAAEPQSTVATDTPMPEAASDEIDTSESADALELRGRVIIQATDEAWIKISGPDGTVYVEKLLLMGEIYRVPDRDGLVLDTGNAGALKILLDGRPIASLGDPGTVLRGISLAPADLLQ